MLYIKFIILFIITNLGYSIGFAQWNTQIVSNTGNTGIISESVIDSDGNSHIFFIESGNHIMRSEWTGNGWVTEEIFESSESIKGCVLTIDELDKLHFAYYYKYDYQSWYKIS